MVMVFIQSDRTLSKAEVATWEQGIAVAILTTLFFGRMWKIWGLWVRKLVGHFRQGLLGHPNKFMEDSSVESSMECGSLAQ